MLMASVKLQRSQIALQLRSLVAVLGVRVARSSTVQEFFFLKVVNKSCNGVVVAAVVAIAARYSSVVVKECPTEPKTVTSVSKR